MQLSNTPGKLVLPFAASGSKNTIPAASQVGIVAGKASLTDGFPPLTRTPLSAGGVPPSGLDMNGILYEMSAVIRWANAGGGYAYDGTFAADSNVGGYPKGARVMRSDGLGYWFNTVENNTTDPEVAGADAAGWLPDFQSGVTALTMTSANVTLTPNQYGKPLIVITGTLTANLNLIFPTLVGKWVVINNCTGNFTITCKTAAGTGKAIYAGYSGNIYSDGTNIVAAGNSDFIGYVNTGTGAVSRTVTAKLNDFISTADYSTLAQAKTAAGNKPVYDPLGILNKDAFNNLTNVFAESGETIWYSATVQRGADNVGNHIGTARSIHTIESRPLGSGADGPTNADYGLTLSVIKQNFLTTTTQGEIDGLQITVRNGGGSNSDSAAILTNSATVNNSGFTASMENQTSQLNGSGTVLKQIQTQIGVIDPINGNYMGYFCSARVGACSDAFYAGDTTGTSWNNFLRYDRTATGGTVFKVNNLGQIVLTDYNNAAALPNKTIRSLAGSLSILNNAASAEIFNLSDEGALNITGYVNANSVKVGTVQVLQSQIAGYGTPTNNSRIANFNASTATLLQTAQMVAQIVVDAKVHGFFGA